MIDVFCPCVPPKTTAQQKRANFKTGVFFKDKKGAQAISTLEGVLMPHQPEKPVSGLVRLSVEVVWPWRNSDINTKAKKAHAEKVGRIPCGSKPDLDNWVKNLQDVLVSLRFIERDEFVCDLSVRKFFGEEPGIRVTVQEVD